MRAFSSLTQAEDNSIKITPKLQELHGISQKALDRNGVPHAGILNFIFQNYVSKSDHICAHNAPFDKAFVDAELVRSALEPWAMNWLDSRTDLPFSDNIQSRSLKYLACEHGFLYDAHSALNDVLAMAKIFCQYDHNKTAELVTSPYAHLYHQSSFEDKALQAKLKEVGFHWDRQKKLWKKTLRSNQLEEELKRLTARGLTPKQNL